MRSFFRRSLALPAVLIVAGCGADASKGDDTTLPIPGTDATTEETSVGNETGIVPDDTGTGLNTDSALANDAPASGACVAADDCDGDGYKTADDCNDKDGTINPDAYDFPDDMVDNDCDGTNDNPVASCAPSALTSDVALDYARVAELCPQVKVTSTGKPFDPVVKAEWSTATGKAPALFFPPTVTLAHHPKATALVEKFGNNDARAGGSMVLLSTGPTPAADPRGPITGDTDRWMSLHQGSITAIADGCAALKLNAADCGSLKRVAANPIAVTDLAELKLTLKAPANAQAMSFDFAFFSTEFNEFHNTDFNDAFFAIVKNSAIAGANVAKDATAKAITVNSGFFQLCPNPAPAGIEKAGSLTNCAGVNGDAAKLIFGTLGGTNFDGAGLSPASANDTVKSSGNKTYIYGGGSGWLTTKFGVKPGETFEIRFLMVDAGDGRLDSAVLIDNIKWEKAPPKVVTGEVDRPPR